MAETTAKRRKVEEGAPRVRCSVFENNLVSVIGKAQTFFKGYIDKKYELSIETLLSGKRFAILGIKLSISTSPSIVLLKYICNFM